MERFVTTKPAALFELPVCFCGVFAGKKALIVSVLCQLSNGRIASFVVKVA
jgi:hypothetical protein